MTEGALGTLPCWGRVSALPSPSCLPYKHSGICRSLFQKGIIKETLM